MRLLKTVISAALCAASLTATTAQAVSFTLIGGNWSPDAGWGAACTGPGCDSAHTQLNMDWAVSSGLPQSFDLAQLGDQFTVAFGTGTWREEDNSLAFAETDNLGIAALLTFTSPAAAPTTLSVTGVTTATPRTLSDHAEDLSISFAPVTIGFGTNGEFTLDLSDLTMSRAAWVGPSQGRGQNTPPTGTVTATFTLTRLDQPAAAAAAVGVPEPATIVLLGLGLAGIGRLKRRQAKAGA